MAKLIDLTGATVTVPSGWSATAGYGNFNIEGFVSYGGITNVGIHSYPGGFRIGYSGVDDMGDWRYVQKQNSIGVPYSSDITPSQSFILEVLGGNDVINPRLIEWFVDNNAIIEGGVWEEEKTPILIKNPITIFNKVEEINGVPIEISSLDNALLVKENEGKVYKYGGKLYRVVADLENITYTSLEGATVRVPSGWTCSAGYGKFSINYSYGVSQFYSLFIGYDSHWGTTTAVNNIILTDSRSMVRLGVSNSFTINIINGPDVTNQSLIQWFVDNDAVIEGATYVCDYIFQEILSPSGTLDITANGEVDVKSYEKVNVNVESSGGAELNIHYGDTAPTDTSKLWVKCDTPSKVEIKNVVEGGSVSLDSGIASLPTGAYGIASASVGTKVYLFGGQSSSSSYLNTINVFDTETNTLQTLSTKLPTGASGIASASVGTKVYLFGGTYQLNTHLNTINVFDTETNTITTLSKTLPTKLTSIASAVIGTKVYLFGGSSSSDTLNSINIFDTETNTLQTLSIKLPTVASGIASASVGTKVYLFGGYSGSYLNTINVFDTETNTITTLSKTLPTGAYGIASASVGTKVYLFGGYSGSYLNTINVFDTETNTLQTLSTKLPTQARKIASAVIGTKVYLFGGEPSSGYLNTINRFNVTYDINNGTLFLLNQGDNKVSIIKTDSLDIEIGVKMVLLGNSENVGEEVDLLKYKVYTKFDNYYTSSASEVQSGTSLTASVKCNVGDLVVCAIATRDTLSVSDGWTLLSTSNVNSVDTTGNGQRLSWAYKYAESTTESITVTQATAQRLYINMIALQGATGVTDNGYSYKNDTTGGDITVTKPSGLVLWGLSSPLWSTTEPYEVWTASNNIPIIQLGTSTQSRLGLGVDQTNQTNVKFTYNAISGASSLIVGCLTVQGMDKFYDEYEVQEWVKI